MHSESSSSEASVSLHDAIFLAAKAGGVEDVQELLRRGVKLDETDHLNNTPLHYAAGAGHVAVVNVLLAHASPQQVNLPNNVGDSPLHKAAWRGNREVVEALLRAGADPTALNKAGQQPFAIAKDSSIASLLEPSPAASEYPEDSDEEAQGGSDSD